MLTSDFIVSAKITEYLQKQVLMSINLIIFILPYRQKFKTERQ